MTNAQTPRPATDDEIRDLVMRRMLPATHGNEDERKAAAKAAKAAEPTAAARAEQAAIDETFHALSVRSTAYNLGREAFEELVVEGMQRAEPEPEPTDEQKAALALLSDAGLGA